LLNVAKQAAAGAVWLSFRGFGPRLLEQEGLYLKIASDLSKWVKILERQYGNLQLRPLDPG